MRVEEQPLDRIAEDARAALVVLRLGYFFGRGRQPTTRGMRRTIRGLFGAAIRGAQDLAAVAASQRAQDQQPSQRPVD